MDESKSICVCSVDVGEESPAVRAGGFHGLADLIPDFCLAVSGTPLCDTNCAMFALHFPLPSSLICGSSHAIRPARAHRGDFEM